VRSQRNGVKSHSNIFKCTIYNVCQYYEIFVILLYKANFCHQRPVWCESSDFSIEDPDLQTLKKVIRIIYAQIKLMVSKLNVVLKLWNPDIPKDVHKFYFHATRRTK